MSDEQVGPSPLEWARMIEDTTQSIMRHVVMPAVMDRVDGELMNHVAIAVERLIEPETERQMITLAQENEMLRDMAREVFRDEELTGLDFYVSKGVELSADQLALARRVVGKDRA